MIFAPHILQVKVITPMEEDEFGRPIPGTGGESWKDVCRCRCDDNSTQKFEDVNGQLYIPKYHIVCDGRISLKAGDYIRCLDGDSMRGEGEVYRAKVINSLNYSELWV